SPGSAGRRPGSGSPAPAAPTGAGVLGGAATSSAGNSGSCDTLVCSFCAREKLFASWDGVGRSSVGSPGSGSVQTMVHVSVIVMVITRRMILPMPLLYQVEQPSALDFPTKNPQNSIACSFFKHRVGFKAD